jgi:hypothetical protein
MIFNGASLEGGRVCGVERSHRMSGWAIGATAVVELSPGHWPIACSRLAFILLKSA